jgi:cupin superfamily acireductone dioxygenase involved in methionine salvage
LFFLQPCTLYRDHIHQASEVYFNLSGPCGFRLGDEDWVDYPGDSIIWNPPSRPHATRVYQTPFLSAVSWVSHLESVCRVIPRDDWQMLEAKLEPN